MAVLLSPVSGNVAISNKKKPGPANQALELKRFIEITLITLLMHKMSKHVISIFNKDSTGENF